MAEYFPGPKSSVESLKVKLDISNYATKVDLKSGSHVDMWHFPKKPDLTYLKSDVDKLDIDKLKIAPSNFSNWKSKVGKLHVDELPVPINLNKLSSVVKMRLLKKMYIMLRSNILKL